MIKSDSMTDDKKTMLIGAAARLLKERDDPESITTREIAAEAGVNLALINYYFGGKAELMREAVSTILSESSEGLYEIPEGMAPKEALFRFLHRMSSIMMEYERYTRVYVPHLLLEDRIELPQMLLPFIRRHFGDGADEERCRLIAFQLVTVFQVLFYRVDDVGEYLGRSIRGEDEIVRIVREEIDILLPGAGQ